MKFEPQITAKISQEDPIGRQRIFPVILMIDVSNSMAVDKKTQKT